MSGLMEVSVARVRLTRTVSGIGRYYFTATCNNLPRQPRPVDTREDPMTITNTDDLRSLRDLMRWGASRFGEAELDFGHGMAEALDEAVYLTLHALHLSPDTDPSWFDSRVTAEERGAVLELL